MSWITDARTWVVELYKTNSKFRALVSAVEGGVIMGFLMGTANGIDLSKKGFTVFCAAVGGGIVTALRNYFVNRPNQPAVIEGEKQAVPPPQG